MSSRGAGRYYTRGHAVPRGSSTFVARSNAQYRHPRAGYGTGYSRGYRYGRGYGYGYRSYGYRNSYSNYLRYPYYGYSPYGWGGLGLSFYYSSGYPYYSSPYPYESAYSAPYDVGYATDEAYAGGADEPDDADAAELRLSVLPEDASVWIDGELRGPARDLVRVTLAPGRHDIEIVRPGFRLAEREVDLRPGATASLRIELIRP